MKRMTRESRELIRKFAKEQSEALGIHICDRCLLARAGTTSEAKKHFVMLITVMIFLNHFGYTDWEKRVKCPHVGGKPERDPAPDAILKIKKARIGIKLIVDPKVKKDWAKAIQKSKKQASLSGILCVIAESTRKKLRIGKTIREKYPHLFFVNYHQLFHRGRKAPVGGSDLGRKKKTLVQLFHYFEMTGGLKN